MDNYQQNPSDTSPVARPTFLTVLCILTFIGSGWGVISNVNSYFSADKINTEAVRKAVDSASATIANQSDGNTPGAKVVEKVMSGASDMMVPEKLKKNALLMTIANLLTLGAGFLMFQQKKTGFWLYLLGVGFSIAVPLLVYGAGNIVSLISSMSYGFFGVLFAVLYAMNLKHMR